MRKLALAVLMVSGVAGGFLGCGGSSPRKVTGTGGHGGNAGGTAGGTAGSAGGTAGDMGMAGSMAGAGGMAGGAAGTGGMAGAAGTGGAAGDGTAGTTPPPPPPITSGTTVIELDDVIVALASTGNADGGTDAAADGGADAGTADGGAADAGDGGASDAGATPSQAVSYTFDTTTQNWKFTPYGSTNPAAPNDPNNLAKTSMLVWSATDDADGKTTSGVLKGTVPFQHDGDQIDFQAFSNGAGMYDWTGMALSAKVKVVSGGNLRQNCPLTAVFYISDSANYNTRISAPINLVVGQWVTVTWTAADAIIAGVNVASVSQMGLQINTGAASACTGPFVDAGTDAPADAPADGGTADAPADTAGQ